MRVLILQHSPVDHAGVFGEYFEADGISCKSVRVERGEQIPRPDDYDVLWIMGGPQDTWQEDEFPWLVEEKVWIREAVRDRRMPVMAFCLGAQLLADALGGEVGRMDKAEFGLFDVALTEAGKTDPLFENVDPVYKTLHWHGAEIKRLPSDMPILAETPGCKIQAFRATPTAYGIQYHMELTAETVTEWGNYDDYRGGLVAVLGDDAVPKLDAEAKQHMPECQRMARQLYDNFMGLVQRSAAS